jgi:enoyl-CoA hydratase
MHTDQPAVSFLSEELVGHSLILRLAHRPVNALSRPLRAQILAALAQAETRAAVHAVVLTGSTGMGFSAGADLAESAMITSPALAVETARVELDFCQGVCRCAKPLIAAIDRYALGGGFELALAADWRLATPQAKLGFPEATLGGFPAGGAIPLMIGLIGGPRTRQLMLTGELLTPQQALALGLVDRVVEAGDLLPEALRLAARFDRRAFGSVRAIKALTRSNIAALRDSVIAGMRELYDGQDLPEGLRAFLEKRAPRFNEDWTVPTTASQ